MLTRNSLELPPFIYSLEWLNIYYFFASSLETFISFFPTNMDIPVWPPPSLFLSIPFSLT